MSEEYHYDKLVVLNQVYQNTVPYEKPMEQPPAIKTKLYPHQQALVQAMHQYRDRMHSGFVVNSHAINGKIGIVGDQAGTGKTLAALAYLATLPPSPTMTSELAPHSSTYFFSHAMRRLTASSSNLIIVPHHLFGQWQAEIQHHTTLPVIPIETKRMIKGNDLLQRITQSRIILTTNKTYKALQDYATENHLQWDNIIMDEAASIYFKPSDPALSFQFLWMMSQNWIPLLFKTTTLHKSTLYYLRDRVTLHPELERWLLDRPELVYENVLTSSAFFKDYLPFFHPYRHLMVLRTAVQTHPLLPAFSEDTLACRPNLNFHSLTSFFLVRNREPHIRSHQIPHLFQALGISFRSVEEYLGGEPQAKHRQIRTKTTDKECVICLETCEYPTMVNCCYQLYCGKCILQHVLLNPKCPTCRTWLDMNALCCLHTLNERERILARNKIEVCMDLFQQNPEGRFIIYSSFDNVYYQLFEEMNRIGCKAERVENHLFSLRKTVKNFQEGKTKILFLSNLDMIRGLSLSCTTHLLFYHELPSYEGRQVLLHSCQRVGRTSSLEVLHLNSEIQV
jgi:SNF2 family DNA or RNA helicase